MRHSTQRERVVINHRLHDLKQGAQWKGINFASQFGRVVCVATGAEWYTLRELEARIANRFPAHWDTQAAISARLREVSPVRHGLVKQRIVARENGKPVHRYRLVPAVSLNELAKRIGRGKEQAHG